MKVTVSHINISRIFKVGFVVNLVIYVCFGLISIVTQYAVLLNFRQLGNGYGAFPILFLLTSLIFIPIGAFLGALAYAVIAFVYNQTLKWTGGIELTLLRSAERTVGSTAGYTPTP